MWTWLARLFRIPHAGDRRTAALAAERRCKELAELVAQLEFGTSPGTANEPRTRPAELARRCRELSTKGRALRAERLKLEWGARMDAAAMATGLDDDGPDEATAPHRVTTSSGPSPSR